MRVIRRILLVCFLGLGILPREAGTSVRTKSLSGKDLHWRDDNGALSVYIDSGNESGLDDDTVKAIAEYSIHEWNDQADIELYPISNQSEQKEEEGRNDLYFSDDDLFGRGVLAVTNVRYLDSTGEIIEADIAINNSVNFSIEINSTSNSIGSNGVESYFLGDVLSHELGHFLGLSHGQVHGSTMIFTVFRGQYSLHSDEKEALNSIYRLPQDELNRGGLTGRIVGSSSRIGIFGAYVYAISSNSGEVIAATTTNSEGGFSLSSLPVNDVYYLYATPLKSPAGLPDYYDTLRSNFCPNGSSWRGSYFQKCGNGERGHPQGFYVAAGDDINVGMITIRCGLEVLDPDIPNGNTHTLNLVQSNDHVGEAVTGFFSSRDIANNGSLAILTDTNQRKNKIYTIDLSSYIPDSTKDLYLDIKTVSQSIYAPLRMSVIVRRTGMEDKMFPLDWDIVGQVEEVSYDPESVLTTYQLDHNGKFAIHVPLDEDTPSNNVFTVELVPHPLTYGLSNISRDDLFPSSRTLSDSMYHFLMIFTISESIGLGEYSIIEEKDHTPHSDNLACLDGPETFIVRANISTTSNQESKKSKFVPLCGTVDFENPNSGGGNFLLILLVGLVMAIGQVIRQRSRPA